MHILNVRFKNLNSLAGEWFLDFERPEYQDEGSFLITGPTGAGKTTILDAICLALYGRTPRVEISDKQNELMTRHTTDCYAEVLFACKDGRYRARSEQRRTRPGSKAPFQTPRRELARENGEIIAEKISEVTLAVEKLTGLKYAQFVRAILLAQGDFDALLKAGEDDKAQILENLTNTSIYRELARNAHERNQSEQEKLAALREKLVNLALPNEDEEKALRQELFDCIQASREIDAALEICEKNMVWRNKVDELRREAEQLEKSWQALKQEETEFAPKLTELEQAKKAAPLQDKYDRREELRKELGQQRRECERNAALLQTSEQKAKLCEEKMAQARDNLAQREKAEREAAPELEKARQLDARLQAESAELKKLQGEITALEQQAKAEALQVRNKERERENCIGDINKNETWLNEHQQAEWLEENLSALKAQAEELRRLRLDAEQAGKKFRRDQKEAVDAEKNLAVIEKKRHEAALGIKAAEGVLQDLEARKAAMLGGKSADAWRREQNDLYRRRCEAVNFRQIQSFAHLLRDGEPCPLCGSIEHPLHSQTEDEDALGRAWQEIDLLLKEVDKIEVERGESANVLDGKRHEYSLLNGKLEGAQQQKELCQRLLAESAANLQKCEDACSTLGNKLAPQFEQFGIELDAKDAQSLLESRLTVWRKVKQDRENLKTALQHLEMELGSLRSKAEQTAQAEQRCGEALAARRQAFTLVQAERQKVLGGRQASAEERRLREEVAGARRELDKQSKAQAENIANLAALKKQKEMLNERLCEIIAEENASAARLAEALQDCDMEEEVFRASLRTPEQIRAIEQKHEELQSRQLRLDGQLKANSARLDDELDKELTSKDGAALQAEKNELLERKEKIQKERLAKEMQRDRIEASRKEALELDRLIEMQARECRRWEYLKKILGAANGKDFQAFAQSITMDILLRHANRHLASITDRYQFQRRNTGKANLDIAVIDNYQAGEVRAISNLSGGETFIASLALALGLSSMASKNAVMGALFLDEGFGTLDPKTLCDALDAIASLRMEGKLIGVISHVEALKEKIATHIQIMPNARGRSEIKGPGCARL